MYFSLMVNQIFVFQQFPTVWTRYQDRFMRTLHMPPQLVRRVRLEATQVTDKAETVDQRMFLQSFSRLAADVTVSKIAWLPAQMLHLQIQVQL